ncbi:MAG: nitroreductase family protein [Immundisolibacterales bacterium]|nr:nitroreductase family protein [Immundisolibacterales bacterium]
MKKPAPADRPIHPLLADRWSPYAFTNESVAGSDLLALFEAARWAASSYNEQPWRFIAARREEPDAFEKVLSCLVPFNRSWAGHAPALALGLLQTLRPGDGSPNRAAEHDLGLAAASLTVEATHRGLSVHQMSGIVADRVREAYDLPDDVLPLTALAIGYAAPLEDTPEDLRERQARPRERRPLPAFVFGERWGEPAAFLEAD